MGDRRCCCLGCLIAEDKFTRDVGTLGANWDVLSGDFAIANDTIHCYHQSCAELSCSHAHADEPSEAMFRIPHREKATWEGSMHVLMRWSNEQYDQKYRIILNAVYNPDTQSLGNHYWAEYYSGTAVIDPTITLGKTSGGVESILATLPVLGLTYDPCDGRTFQAKIGSDGICANVTYGVQSFVWAMHEGMNATGRYSGMAVDETDPWHITHFQLYEHYDTNNDCDYCRCTCNGTPLPH